MSDGHCRDVRLVALSEQLELGVLNVKGFDCGDAYLNRLSQKDLIRFDQLGKHKAFIAVDGADLCGFITLVPHQIIPAKGYGLNSFRTVPVLMIEQVATNLKHQGRGIGRRLMSRAFKSALNIRTEAGITGVALWSHPDAKSFYEGLGFNSFAEKEVGPLTLTLMFLPIATILDASACAVQQKRSAESG
jgi:GNAT superfamily N-acetyltransferase